VSNENNPLQDNPYEPPETSGRIVSRLREFEVWVKLFDENRSLGAYKCEIFERGIVLRQGNRQEFKLPIGIKATYLGKNGCASSLTATWGGREE
jgi:hypothetical protein